MGANEVLFIGNSFTIGGTASVPVIFDRLAIAGGQADPNTVMRAVGGEDYQFHVGDATTQAAIVSRQWTHVIIQNYSTQPTHLGVAGQGVAAHYTYGTQLYDQIIANRPDTQVILFETWSRAASHALITGTSDANGFASTAEMQSELRTNYRGLADSLNSAHPASAPILVGPVGDAFENAGGLRAASDPSFVRLHGPDDYHANDNGYFLAAAVFYSTIYGVSPVGLHTNSAVTSLNLNLTVDPTFLEQIAWDTVRTDVPVTFTTHPASRTVNENAPVTFTAAVAGSPPYDIQWKKDNQPISGATSLSYTIPSAARSLDGAIFTVTVTNGTSTATSNPATLTVTPDNTPPALSAATATGATTLTLTFSEPLSPIDPRAFTIASHGQQLGVLSATLSPDRTTVTLTLASDLLPGNFALGLDPAITDLNANPIPPDTLLFGNVPSPGATALNLLIDFGDPSTTTTATNDPVRTWNNLTSTVAATSTGSLPNLLSTTGTSTGIALQMIRRFNGVNTNGTTTAAIFPASATRDSLYGNTETFNGLVNIFPGFKFTGLNPALAYSLTFYASRLGVADNRTTLYTVTGATTVTTTLNAVGNMENVATLANLSPSAAGELSIGLTPAAGNNNANHFTYLNALQLSGPTGPAPAPTLYPPVRFQGKVILDWTGGGQIEYADHLGDPWTPVPSATTPPFAEPLAPTGTRFYRLHSATP